MSTFPHRANGHGPSVQYNILALPGREAARARIHTTMISVSHVIMQLSGGGHVVTILDDVSFAIPEKQMVAIVGPSGSGKSTLLGLLAGLDKPTAGSIAIDGVEITSLPESDMAGYRLKKIGYVFQAFHLIPTLTALENVAVPLELNR